MIELAVISRVLLKTIGPIMEEIKKAKTPEDMNKLQILEKRDKAMRSIKPIITKDDFLAYEDPYDIINNQGLYPVYKIHGSKNNIVTGASTLSSLVTTMWALGKDREEGKTFDIEPYKEPAMNNLMRDRMLCIMGYSGQDDFDIGPLLKNYPYLSCLIWIEHTFDNSAEIFTVNKAVSKNFEFLTLTERLLAEISSIHDFQVFQVKINTRKLIEDVLWPHFLSDIDLPDLNYYDIKPEQKPPSFKEWIIPTIGDVDEVKKCQFTCSLYNMLGQVEDTIRVAQKGLTLVKKDEVVESKNFFIFFHEKIAKMSSLKLDFNASLKNYEECLRISIEMDDLNQEVYFTDLIGTVYYKLGNPVKALNYYNKALNLNKKLDDDQRHASILSNVAQVYLDNQEYEKALQNFQASLKIYHSIGHLTSKAACLVNIGSIHFELENYDNALEPLEDALKIVKQNVDFHLQMVCLNSIGVIYSSRGDDDKALQKFEEAREVRFKMGLNEDGSYHLHVGYIYYEKRDFDIALDYFKKGLKLAEQQKNMDLLPGLMDMVATTLDSKKQYSEAKIYYEKALILFKTLGLKYNEKLVQDKLATLEEKIQTNNKSFL
jgi:tetratricopeptide (TPR) repeat protein